MPLTAHFLNVGHGDCTIIEFPSGNVAMIDIDNLRILDEDTCRELLEEYRDSIDYLIARHLGGDIKALEREFIAKQQEKLTDPLAYYDLHVGQFKDIFRFIATHPDMDHLTGLYRLHEQDPRKNILNFWHTGNHDFNLADDRNPSWENCRYDRRDWLTYKKLRASSSNPKSLQKYQGEAGNYWTDDGIEVWAPTPGVEATALIKDEPNILSIVLKISYKGRSIVLGGDATATETWPAIYPNLNMTGIDVLKASHHGRNSGYYQPAVKEMAPWLTITSVGEREHDATPKYRQYSEYTVSLRKTGDIRVQIKDDGTLVYPARIEEHWKPKC